MRIGFVGCGAIGSCYASYLVKAHEVCVLDTSEKVINAVKEHGILVDQCAPGHGNGETVAVHPAIATTDPKEIGVVDILVVFVHYQYLESAVRNALPMIDKHTMVMCLQNGYGNYDEIAKVVPEEQIVIGNTAFGATPVEPGHVKHTGYGAMNIGTIKAPKEKVLEVAEAFRAADLDVDVHDNVMNAIWHKLLANVAINGVSALLETKNGFISQNPYANKLTEMLIGEAILVANADGCTLNYEEELEHAYDVSRKTDETISSMVQDVIHHRETEIRIINGAVSKLGKKYNIPTPANDTILNLVLAKQSLYLGK
ncbi:MAG: 2-dehydropantoate 2-reductase [Eubacterium sp.]|jgi:2-dehydropantoate 2-reductase|uniref:ketopantoate reductase family protein n=1 Tax=Eubacterium sp. F2 TaxID=3381348 RepID=UPI0039084287|nr:2-dehydropantoate 2-reductase [Eubacterium sp.]MCI2198084.1 2-dehydropantoate 2-reductase [Eubacterium sp.]